MLLILLSFSILPSLYPLRKILKRQNLNLVDILQVSTTLYYALIPIKVLYIDLPELLSDYSKDIITPVYYLIFNLLLLLVNIFWSNNYQRNYTPINITNYIRYWDRRIVMKDSYVYLFLIFFVLFLIPLTNYSALTEDNLEQNVTAGYGLGMSFWQRISMIFLYNSYPVFIILNIKYSLNNKCPKFFRKLSIVSFIIGLLCMVLASKTVLLFTLVFMMIYVYSVRKDVLNRTFLVKALIILAIGIFVIFPLSQGFRMLKQSKVLTEGKVDFTSIAVAYINMDDKEKRSLDEGYQIYKGRSLNVYQTLHWATTNNFRGDGKLTIMVFKYLFPRKIHDSKEGNILGDTYLGKGADIGESVLAWYIADWGSVGLLITIIHFIVILVLWYLYKTLFLKLFTDPKIEFLFIYYILSECINIENNPSAYIHGFYSQWVIIFLIYVIVFRVFGLFRS